MQGAAGIARLLRSAGGLWKEDPPAGLLSVMLAHQSHHKASSLTPAAVPSAGGARWMTLCGAAACTEVPRCRGTV